MENLQITLDSLVSEKNNIILSRGRLKDAYLENPVLKQMANEYWENKPDLGIVGAVDTPEQKERLLNIIDGLEGAEAIFRHWTNEYLTKEQAKDYVLNYENGDW